MPKQMRVNRKRTQPSYYAEKQKLSINLAQDVSDHASELLWGQGFKFTHTNETANKRLQEIIKHNQLQELLPYSEKLNSLFGNIYWTLDMVDGIPTWIIADPYLNSMGNNNQVPSTDGTIYGIGRALVNDQVAVIWKKITYGTIAFPIKEVHYPDRVERFFYGSNNKQVTVAAVNKAIPEELQLDALWIHNIGLIDGKLPTITWSKNFPTFNAHSFRDGYKGDSLQVLIDKTLSELWHETETNRTRIIGNLDETTYNQIMKNGDLAEINKNDFLINVKMKNSTGGVDNQLIPILADPKFEAYWGSINKAKDQYYQLAGYSPLGDGNTEKTATENLLMKTNDYQTTKKKRNQRYLELAEHLAKVITMDSILGFGNIYGEFKQELSIEIMENKVMDSLNEMATWETAMDLGLMSRVEVIAERRGITKKEAEAIMKEIDNERVADAKLLQEITPQEDKEDKEDKGDDE